MSLNKSGVTGRKITSRARGHAEDMLASERITVCGARRDVLA
jgi:hypothetical protein